MKDINKELDFIEQEVGALYKQSNKIEDINDVINIIKPKLKIIESSLGDNSITYIKLSSGIVDSLLAIIVELVRETIWSNNYESSPTQTINKVKGAIRTLKTFKMNSDTIARFTDVETSVVDMNQKMGNFRKNLNSITNPKSSLSPSSSSSSEGCYIATMAYGDYEHPQVLLLRKFRDESLSKSSYGRKFISFYYATSPSLVNFLKNQHYINKIIRVILDKYIGFIKISKKQL